MIDLKIKNISEIDEKYHPEIYDFCENKIKYFNELFKKYSKNLTMEIIFDHSSSLYKISAGIDLKSKKIISAEEGKDIMPTLDLLCNKFKKAVKKQHDLELKEHTFKRKR
ncbi:MAG TPA: hypothetical protein ENK91_07445 [Bacteroidetes bacterium]|nr:hypothetical protein [Bacteroidota bacterium]